MHILFQTTHSKLHINITPNQKVEIGSEDSMLWGAFLPQEDLYPNKEGQLTVSSASPSSDGLRQSTEEFVQTIFSCDTDMHFWSW